jgi:hypothetical protein
MKINLADFLSEQSKTGPRLRFFFNVNDDKSDEE